jgi:hypothetical protein
MSIASPALIAARADACAWLRRQMQAMDRLHRECGDGRRRPLVTMRAGERPSRHSASGRAET